MKEYKEWDEKTVVEKAMHMVSPGRDGLLWNGAHNTCFLDFWTWHLTSLEDYYRPGGEWRQIEELIVLADETLEEK